MNCQHWEKLIHAYHDGELDIAATLDVDEHLAECPRCAGLSRSLSTLSSALRNDAGNLAASRGRSHPSRHLVSNPIETAHESN